jgi:hypothetical protein
MMNVEASGIEPMSDKFARRASISVGGSKCFYRGRKPADTPEQRRNLKLPTPLSPESLRRAAEALAGR